MKPSLLRGLIIFFLVVIILPTKVLPASPTLFRPANNSECFLPSDTLFWHKASNVLNYTVVISNNSDGSAPIIEYGVGTDTMFVPSVTTPALQYETTYYWKVKLVTSGLSQDSSALWSFNTKIYPPTLNSPSNQSTCQPLTVTLKWTSNPVQGYRVQVSQNSNFSTILQDFPNVTSNSKQVTVPGTEITYYWRVAKSTAGCTSDFSTPFSFTTLKSPATLNSPANNATGQPLVTNLKWTTNGTVVSNSIQVATDTAFMSKVVDDFSNSNTYSASLTNYNTTFYWRVKTTYQGCEADWSNYYTLTTMFPNPTLLTPRMDSLCVPQKTKIEWQPVTGATAYHYQIATDKDFLKVEINKTGVRNTADTVNLANGLTNYFWRVRAEDPSNIGAWSDTSRFQTIIGLVQRVSPKDKDTLPLAMTFTWKKIVDNATYRIQISEYPDFKINLVDSKTTELSYNYTLPNYYKSYYWRISASQLLCDGPWSSGWEVRTALVPPQLIMPANKATKVSIKPVFQWDKGQGMDKFLFHLSKDQLFTTLELGKSGLPTTSLAMDKELETNTTYYWRVQGSGPVGTSGWSATFSFTTGGKSPDVPTLVSPANGTDNLLNKVRLTWNKANRASKYNLQVSEFDSFSSLAFNSENITDTTYEVPGLGFGKTYYWHVSAINDTGRSNFSDTWSFSTTILAPSDTAFQVSPSDGSKGLGVQITFIWQQVQRADSYELQISDEDQFVGPTYIYYDSVASTSKYLSSLPYNTLMYWRVRAGNASGKGPWSSPWSLKTIVDDVNDPVLDNQYSFAIQPNPARESALISFNLPQAQNVKVVVYDLLGNQVLNLADNFYNQGYVQINWNTKEMNSGAYTVKVKIGNYEKAKQVIIEK